MSRASATSLFQCPGFLFYHGCAVREKNILYFFKQTICFFGLVLRYTLLLDFLHKILPNLLWALWVLWTNFLFSCPNSCFCSYYSQLGGFFILLFYFWTWATVIIYLPISDSENPSQPLCLCWCLSLCFYCHDKTPWPRAACGGGIFGSLILGHSPLKEVEGSRNSNMHLEARIDVEAMKKWCLQACSIWFLLAPMSSRPGATLSTVNWSSRINHKLRKYITGSSCGSIFSVEDLFPTIILLVSSSTKLASTTSFYAHWV